MSAPLASLLTPRKKRTFLLALAETGNVTDAAKRAATSRDSVYRLRREDAEFAAAWEDAVEQAVDTLEQEARRRAFEGVEEPLTCARGLVLDDFGNPVTVRKYSDTLLIFLLKGARPEKYRDNAAVAPAPSVLGISVILERMRDDSSIRDAAAGFVGVIESTGQAES